MQANSSALAGGASSAAAAKGASKPSTAPGATYQVKGAGGSSIASGTALMKGMAPNAPSEQLLATTANNVGRPLGVSGGLLGSGMAPSTSQPSALFAQPLFQGLPKLPDGSPEGGATAPSNDMNSLLGQFNSVAGGAPSSSSLGGGSGLLFGPLGGGGALATPLDGTKDTQSGSLDRAANLRAGQISAGFVPLGNSGSRLGGPLLFGDGGAGVAGLSEQPQAGELISGTYATYHGPIDLMVPTLAQDANKSFDTLSDLNVSKSKFFRSEEDPAKTVLVFLAQNARNISFVINQEELCDNVLSLDVMQNLGFKKENGVDLSQINDFTLIEHQYLIVLMNQGHIVVFDCSMVLSGSARQLRFVNQDQIRAASRTVSPDENTTTTATQESSGAAKQGPAATSAKPEQVFTRIESMEIASVFEGECSGDSNGNGNGRQRLQYGSGRLGSEPRRVLVFGKQAYRMLCLEFPRSDSPDMDMMEHPLQAELQIPSKLENRQILDLAVMEPGACGENSAAAFLFSDNLIAIFDLVSRTAVFKVKYNDATDNVSQLFFVADNMLEQMQVGTPNQAAAGAQSSPTTTGNSSEVTMMGFFLLTETKLVSKQDSKSRSKHLRKLHLVQMQQTQVTSRSKVEKRDKIEQIDSLSFAEETPKLVDFVRCKNQYGIPNYFAFLLNRERVKANGALKLMTVKIRWAPNEDTKQEDNSFDSDIREESKKANKAKDDKQQQSSKWKLKFDFVTSLMPKIDSFKGEKLKPNYLNIVEAVEEGDIPDEAFDDDAIETQPMNEAVFYVYTGVGSQSVVFKKLYSEIAHPHEDERTQKVQVEEARTQMNQIGKKRRQRSKHSAKRDGNKQTMSTEDAGKAQQRQSKVNSIAEFDAQEDPAIMSQSSRATTAAFQQPNPESTSQEPLYKKKAEMSNSTTTTSATTTQPAQSKKAAKATAVQQQAQAQSQQPVYKTKNGSTKEISPNETAEKKEAQASDDTEAASTSQQVASQKKSKSKEKSKKEKEKEQQQQQNQVPIQVQVPQTKKQQQDQIIENYQELNKKFTELHMKMNSLQQQVKAQKDLQIQVEQTITKAVKTCLPEMIKKQVEETVQPMMQKQMEQLDQQVTKTLLPRIEQQLSRLGGSPGPALAAGQPAQMITTTGQAQQMTDSAVRKVIHQEFRQAMANQIMPELERELKIMLSKVKEPITSVNKVLYEKLINDESKSDQMVQSFEQRLHAMATQQHYQSQFMAAPQVQQLQGPPPTLSQSFSLQPQNSQSAGPYGAQIASPQPIFFHAAAPGLQPHYQVQQVSAPQQQQHQHFNMSQDNSMIQQQFQQQQQAQPQQLQMQQPVHANAPLFPPFSSGGQQMQTQQQSHGNGSFQPLQPSNSFTAGGTGTQQLQTPTPQQVVTQSIQMQQPQLQPTSTNFVPTQMQFPQQSSNSAATTTTTMAATANGGNAAGTSATQQVQPLQQTAVSAPTFTPQATAFHPTNQPTTMMAPLKATSVTNVAVAKDQSADQTTPATLVTSEAEASQSAKPASKQSESEVVTSVTQELEDQSTTEDKTVAQESSSSATAAPSQDSSVTKEQEVISNTAAPLEESKETSQASAVETTATTEPAASQAQVSPEGEKTSE